MFQFLSGLSLSHPYTPLPALHSFFPLPSPFSYCCIFFSHHLPKWCIPQTYIPYGKNQACDLMSTLNTEQLENIRIWKYQQDREIETQRSGVTWSRPQSKLRVQKPVPWPVQILPCSFDFKFQTCFCMEELPCCFLKWLFSLFCW